MIQNTMNEGNTILEIDIRTRDVEAIDRFRFGGWDSY